MLKIPKDSNNLFAVQTFIIIAVNILTFALSLVAVFQFNQFSFVTMFLSGPFLGAGVSMFLTSQTTFPNIKRVRSTWDKIALLIVSLLTGLGLVASMTLSNPDKSRLAKITSQHSSIPAKISLIFGFFLLIVGLVNLVIPIPPMINQIMDFIFGDN